MRNSLKSWFGLKQKSPHSILPIQEESRPELKTGPVLIHDAYDELIFAQAAQSVVLLKQLLEEGSKGDSDIYNHVFDLFALFYKAEPEFTEGASECQSYEHIRALMQDGSVHEERRSTRFHILNSLSQAMVYAEKWLNDTLKEEGRIQEETKACVKSASQLQEGMKAWGIGGLTQNNSLNLEQVIRIMNLVNQSPEFLNMAEQVGRMNIFARGVRGKKAPIVSNRRSGVTLGKDILNALPTELALLASDKTQPVFYKKISESNLLIYDQKVKKNCGQGPLIVLVDTSDSLNGEKGYVTKAIAASLYQIAQKENRWLSVIVFSGGNGLKEFLFDPKKYCPDEFIEMVTLFYGGGTSFDECIELGLHRLQDKHFERADVVFISDFDGPIEEENFNRLKQTKVKEGLRWFSLLIPSQNRNSDLVNISDSIDVIHLDFGEHTKTAFTNILKKI